MRQITGTYLGIEGYGTEKAAREFMDALLYRFLSDGRELLLEIDNGERKADGAYAYPIQNLLQEGCSYQLSVEGNVVKSADPMPREEPEITLPVSGTPGKKTILNFLALAMEPVGTALYIFGGGWNWQDNAASVQAVTIGVSRDWVRFFREQDENFTYRDRDGDEKKKDAPTSYYPYGQYNAYYYAGLDCAGYVGWALYNLFNTENGKEGYVTFASQIGKMLSKTGLGSLTREKAKTEIMHETSADEAIPAVRPGDIISTDGHVWISLGTCSDGSIVILHSTPSVSRTGQPGGGVQISAVGMSEECEALSLAEQYMSKYYPAWYRRYPAALKKPEEYFSFHGEDTGIFSWNIPDEKNGLEDPEGVLKMSPAQILQLMFQ